MFGQQDIKRKSPESVVKKRKTEMKITTFNLFEKDKQELVDKYVGILYPSFSELVRSMVDYWFSRFFSVDKNGESLIEYLTKLVMYVLSPIDLERHQLPNYSGKASPKKERARLRREKPRPVTKHRTINIQNAYLDLIDPIMKIIKTLGFREISRSMLFRNLLHKWLIWKENIRQNINNAKEILNDPNVVNKFIKQFRRKYINARYDNNKRTIPLLPLQENLEEGIQPMPIFKITDENRHLFEDKKGKDLLDQLVENENDLTSV